MALARLQRALLLSAWRVVVVGRCNSDVLKPMPWTAFVYGSGIEGRFKSYVVFRGLRRQGCPLYAPIGFPVDDSFSCLEVIIKAKLFDERNTHIH